MNHLILASLLILTLACSKDKDKDDKGKGGKIDGGGNVEEAMKDVTDTSSCSGTATNPSIFSRQWLHVEQGASIRIIQYMKAETNAVSLKVICQRNSMMVEANVRALARVTANSIEVLGNDYDEQSVSVGDEKLNCSASLQRSDKALSYSFQGPCLRITEGNQSMIYPPVF